MRIFTLLNANRSLPKRIAEKTNDALPTARIKPDEVFEIIKRRLIDPFIQEDKRKDEDAFSYAARVAGAASSIAVNGYFRREFTGQLVDKFVSGVRLDFDNEHPWRSQVFLEEEIHKEVEVFKHLTYEVIIMSPRLKIVEHRGYNLVKTLFETLDSDWGYHLLPDHFQSMYETFESTDDKKRLICDFIAGMTDSYANEFYERIQSTGPSIFKPF
jgi:dGTPase